ncbi:srg family chemoreceptor domain-containing protein [Ditylenchus destructor]|uniref:Serpentine receptor class gamma n=1 Tax=Ditylenchus destructor TaxID=166010 RepID=A0AAD4NAS4_9BILA|nr:srg family chemoreceptor domain-containing protein [Ditylenchus destructor]
MSEVLAQAIVIPFVFAALISVPSIILYAIEAVLLIKHWKKFKSAFFRLFIARFVSNFLNYFCSYIYMRFGRVGLFADFFEKFPTRLLSFFFFSYYYNYHAENMSTFFILLNRFTVIFLPTTHTKLWKYLLPVTVIIIFLSPFPFTYADLFYDFYIRRQEDKWTYTIALHVEGNIEDYLNVPYIAAVCSVIFCIASLILNLASILVYKYKKKFRVNPVGLEEQKVELRLTIYALITFLAQLLLAIYTILISIASSNLEVYNLFLITFNQMPWINDLATIVVPSWCMLWASADVRTLVFDALGLMLKAGGEESRISSTGRLFIGRKRIQPTTATQTINSS